MKISIGGIREIPLKIGLAGVLLAFSSFVFLESIAAQTAAMPAKEVSITGSALSARARSEIFEEVWQTINEKYYDAKFHGVDWNAVRRRYEPQAAKTVGEKDFYALLDKMVGELRDSHTRVYSPLQREQQLKMRRTSVGIAVRNIENKPVIVSVAPDSEAARTGVKAGMIVRKIDGREAGAAIDEARGKIGASSSERALEMRVYSKILAGEAGTHLNFELIDREGNSLNVSLPRQTIASKPSVSTRILDSGVAYLKFTGFDESLENEIKDALSKLSGAPALILDLRDNPGGDGEMGLRLAGGFFEREITVADLVTRTGKPPIPEMPMTLRAGGKNAPSFSRPVAVLINEATASTAELITNAMQEQKRAVVFGTPSCGCVLGFLDYKKLKNGGFLTMSEFGFITPKKRTLEGVGVIPDRIVTLIVNDIASGRDAALAQAERFLINSRSAQP